MAKKWIVLTVLLCALAPVLALSAPEITPQPGQVNPYKTRAELLMQATRHVGVTTPEQAAALWAQGVQQRSAALQYVAMTESLRAEYAAGLDAQQSNWVTGMSSPWVEDDTMRITVAQDGQTACAALTFALLTSAGPAGHCSAQLQLMREDGFWRVSAIEQDDALYAYTRYGAQPN